MTKGVAVPPTMEQILRFGPIAEVLKTAMERKGLVPNDLRKIANVGNSGVYGWLNAKGGMAPYARKKLAAALDLKPEQLDWRTYYTSPQRVLSPPQRIAPVPQTASGAARMEPLEPEPPDLLSFIIQADGRARIKLEVELSLDRAMPLMRLLMDAGLVVDPGRQSED